MASASPPAHAYNFVEPVTIDWWTYEVCPHYVGFTNRLVFCIKETLVTAMYDFMVPWADYWGKTITAMFLLAIIIWSALMITGKNSAPMRDAAVTAIKIGAVSLCTSNFANIFELMLDCMEYLLWAVTYFVHFSTFSYWSPVFGAASICVPSGDAVMIVWQSVDCALESLVGGIMAPWTLFGGLVGFLVAALFSQPVGFFVAIAGFMLIMKFVMALIRAVYIFITAYIAVCLMALVSPIFIPLVLFRATKGFFEKWLKLTLGFMLQPVFLFAYLAMLLIAYDSVVYTGPVSLYRAIVGDVIEAPCYFWNGTSLQFTGNWPCFTSLNEYLLGVNPAGIPAYAQMSHSSVGVGLNASQSTPGGLGTLETGAVGVVGQHILNSNAWLSDVFNVLGPSFYKVDLPTRSLNWEVLAQRAGYGVDVDGYQIDLVFSMAMAVIMAYIFVVLQDMLPYVGSGISGDMLSMPALGHGKSGSPANKLVTALKSKLSGGAIK
jgi:hypothetical protein